MVATNDAEAEKPDANGFVSYSALAAKAARGRKAFCAAHPLPALLIVRLDATFADQAGEADSNARTPGGSAAARGGFALLTQQASDTARATAARFKDKLAFLAKRPGNPFAQMITVGRAPNNDIVLPLETVSKLHGYFVLEGDRWQFTDHRSTNGTIIDGRRVPHGEKVPLTDGHRFRFGLDIAALFLTPVALFDHLSGA